MKCIYPILRTLHQKVTPNATHQSFLHYCKNIIIHLYALVILRLKLHCRDISMALFFFLNSYFDTFSLAWKANVSLYWFYSSPLANIDFPSPPPPPRVMNKSKINVSVLLHDNSYSVPFVPPFQLARNFIIRDSSLQTVTRHPSQSYFHSRKNNPNIWEGTIKVLLFASITSLII